MGFSIKKKKKICRGHLYFSCWDGNIRIYPWVNLYAKFWEYHAACCYTKVVHPWPTLKETKNILRLAFLFCFVFLVGGKITHGAGRVTRFPHHTSPSLARGAPTGLTVGVQERAQGVCWELEVEGSVQVGLRPVGPLRGAGLFSTWLRPAPPMANTAIKALSALPARQREAH